ncbi:MAG: twin-arginine translocation pathway signal protein [Chloroflexi bacterium]|nr:MAG: twin-arginine translocation pathway signal protein [Chloroflexota bacterium]
MQNKRHLKISFLVILVVLLGMSLASPAAAQVPVQEPGQPVVPITLLSDVQAADPIEFETTRLLAENMRQLGFEVEHLAQPRDVYLNFVWFNRMDWQMTAWRMVGRPERIDPDEFTFNLFHSSTAESGFNFVGYNNPEYDAIAEAQRVELDVNARRDLIFQAQEIIAEDVPYVFIAHPSLPQLVRTDIWDASTIVDQQGIGLENFWTWTGLTPLGDQRTIIAPAPSNLNAINPLFISGGDDSRITELVWDRLMRIGPDGLPQPWAAEEVTREDDLNVLVRIREGMTWHDGEPVTVEDVKFSFEAPQTGESPMYEPFVSNIADIQIVDDQTVRFVLKEPSATFEIATLSKLNLIPKHIWEPLIEELLTSEDNAESIQEDIPIGSGPYRIVDFDLTEQIILEANPDHFSPPKADGLVLRIIPNAESQLGQIQTGEINFLRNFQGDSEVLVELAESDPNIELFSSPSLGFRFFAFNERVDPFDDPALRRAIAYITPREPIINNIFKGFAVPADSFVSTAIEFWHNPNLPQYEFDFDRAREILAEAGYTWDENGRLIAPPE